MNDNKLLVCVMTLWILAAALFCGEPDLTDAVIAHLCKGTACERGNNDGE